MTMPTSPTSAPGALPSPFARTRRVHWLPGLLLAAATTAQGQAIPDAGSVRQQIDPQHLPTLPPPQSPKRPAEPPPLQPRSGTQVTVKAFRFAGNTLLDDATLAAAVSGWVGRPLSFDELQRAPDAIAAAYRQAGWFVRAYLPEQDITEGLVTVQIIEAHYGGLRFEGAPPSLVPLDLIEAPFKVRQRPGEPLDAAALDRALLLADDLPGVAVSGTLVPGAEDGETALVLKSTDEARLYGDAGLDNNGARATGSSRATLNLNLNSPTGRGELVGLNLLHSEGSDFARLGLTMPLGADGLRLGFSGSAMKYRVIAGPAAASAAPIRGHSASLGADLSYPLLRSRSRNVYLSGGIEEKTFVTRDSLVRSDYLSDSLRAGLAGNWIDELGGGGANNVALQFTLGRLGQLSAHPQLDSIDRTYRKLNYAISRQQALWPEHSLYLGLSGQHATQVLDSSEKLFIGGAGSVRAYPTSELGGERGQLASAEWRWKPSPQWILSAFLDWGRTVSLSTLPGEAATVNLRGYGLGALWQGPAGLTVRLSWSHRNGQNPHPTPSGTDGDGTLRKNRLWTSVTLPF